MKKDILILLGMVLFLFSVPIWGRLFIRGNNSEKPRNPDTKPNP